MSKLGLYDDVVTSLQKAILHPSAWSRAFRLIDEAVGIHGSTTVLAAGERTTDVRIFAFWYYDRGIRQFELENLYFKDYYDIDERIPRVRRIPENKVVHIKDLYTASELKRSAAYNEAMAICNGQDSLHVRLAGPNDTRITWVPNDPTDREGWSTGKLALMRRLFPHLHHAIWAEHTLNGAGILTSTLADLLGATGLGIIQLDGRGRIFDINDRGKRLLRNRETIYDRHGFLHAKRRLEDVKLQKLISRAIPSRGSVGYGGTTTFNRWPKPPLLTQIHPIQAQEEDPRTWSVAALVVISDLPGRPEIDQGVVAQTLNFTGMESRVAVMLAEGKTVPLIAEELGRKESTIRHHVKRMFTKHNLSRQTELIDLVRAIAGAPRTET
ncbi:MAG: helix-turn-helix transcriptional regulator [Gammaproteobacteria bacterium]|nr:helix-turn-helix transcriptional regulator [Gammaproteobacteria bacterium]